MDIDGVEYFIGASTSVEIKHLPAAYLLPPFDEYTVAYNDRSAVVAADHRELASSGGVFRPIIVVDGQVVGTWKAAVKKGVLDVIPTPFAGQRHIEENAVRAAAKRYADFRGLLLSSR